jgi:putative photosynthetic complex assembly protein
MSGDLGIGHHRLAAPIVGLGALAIVSATVLMPGRAHGPDAAEPAPAALVARELAFHDRPDGGVAVLDAARGAQVATLDPGQDHFIRVSLRALIRYRSTADIDSRAPFRLTQWSDGRLTIEDPTTGRLINLGAFGQTNAAAYARLLTAAGG